MSFPPIPDEPSSSDVWRRPAGGAPPPPLPPPLPPPVAPPDPARIQPPGSPGVPDEVWARPDSWSTRAGGAPVTDPGAASPPARPGYSGPPRAAAPPSGWKPATVVAVPLANTLPPQHDEAIDAVEAQARTITYGVGMIAGAVLLIMLLVICARWLSF